MLQSELFLLSLAANCCTAAQNGVKGSESVAKLSLEEDLVSRLFDVCRGVLEPIPDDYVLPTAALVDIQTERSPLPVPRPDGSKQGEADCLEGCLMAFERDVKVLLEFLTDTNWSWAFEYVKQTLYNIRTSSFPDGAQYDAQGLARETERPALVTLRLISFFVLDSSRLGQLVQEICSSYLHFRKSFQSTIAVALPLTILRWVERYPQEFVRLHLSHKRLEGGADTLFDMTQTGIDSSRRSAVLYPLQTALLLLLPDVFEVASNLREAKGSSLIKKTMFLDGLRKAFKNGNERAACCVVQLLRAARHFELEADSALVSYAMDVQDEVRDAVFGVSSMARSGAPPFDQDVVTGTFIGIVHLGLVDTAESLVNACTAPSAPPCFKLAVIQACSYFSSQRDAGRFTDLVRNAIPFIQTEFAVWTASTANIQR